jgi:hypothetical protein
MQKKLLVFILLLTGISCARKKTEPAAVMQLVKETGQLVTAEYTLSKIIKASDDKTWYKVGSRKILIQCEAVVKAGVDLQAITADNIAVTGKSIVLVLPPAQLFSLQLPPDKIQVQYQEVDLLRDPFTAAEREQLLAQAEVQIRQVVDSLGVLKTAETNAALYLQRLLRYAGYEQVHISFTRKLN